MKENEKERKKYFTNPYRKQYMIQTTHNYQKTLRWYDTSLF